jgi:hypothetical protein
VSGDSGQAIENAPSNGMDHVLNFAIDGERSMHRNKNPGHAKNIPIMCRALSAEFFF